MITDVMGAYADICTITCVNKYIEGVVLLWPGVW